MKTLLHYFTSPTKAVKEQSVEEMNKSDDVNKTESNDCSNTSPSSSLKTENAFKVMMDSRSKVIGRNSPGKELTDQSDDDEATAKKQTLKERQNLMKKWAEDKGATKRKRDEEERETFINNQMEKRTRRMKKLLEFNKEESTEVPTKRNKPKRSDSTWKMKIKLNESTENERILRPRKEKKGKVLILSSDEEDLPPKPRKVAPLFTKNSPKPKLDPEQAAARKSFLLSGLPSSLKKTVEKEQALEDRQYDIFPQISHIQQFSIEKNVGTSIGPLEFKEISPLRLENVDLLCEGLINSESSQIQWKTSEKITKFTQIVKEIKMQQPNYPVYKTFKQIHSKFNKKKKKPLLWTTKYAPITNEEFLGNKTSVDYVKDWLNKFGEKGKKRRKNSESDFEFSSTDGESSRDSWDRTGSNTLILVGPPGSGKTSTIFGLCKELGYEVLEVNASSRRTGKKLLQTVQEATQSHRMTKNDKTCKEISVLLVEDIDIVFDQDDGFIAALLQLIQTTKRPIILTTTDPGSSFVQRFTNYRFVVFRSMSSNCLGTFLQLVCLVEGLQVEHGVMCTLLDYFKGDARRALSQLQFWVLSGGDLTVNSFPFKIRNSRMLESSISVQDDSNLSLTDGRLSENERFLHRNCFRSLNKQLTPQLIWNNMSNLPENSTIGKISELHGNLTFLDRLSARFERNFPLRDGIGTSEVHEEYNSMNELVNEYSEVILNGCEASRRICEMGLDILGDSKVNMCSKEPFNFNLNRKSCCLDYFSGIRHINRLEETRAKNNTKRGNRFRHYLDNEAKHFNFMCKSNIFI